MRRYSERGKAIIQEANLESIPLQKSVHLSFKNSEGLPKVLAVDAQGFRSAFRANAVGAGFVVGFQNTNSHTYSSGLYQG